MEKLELDQKIRLADIAYRTKTVDIEQQLRDQGLKNIKVEAIAQGKYVEDGLNAVIYSTEINGKKESQAYNLVACAFTLVYLAPRGCVF